MKTELRHQKVIDLFKSGVGVKQIAKKAKYSENTVRLIIRKNNLREPKRNFVDLERVKELLLQGYTTQEVANMFNCHIDLIYKKARILNLKRKKVYFTN